MTSCHDVTKPDLPISACRCARKLILFLFPMFFRSLGYKMLLILHWCDDVTSCRHVMTSQTLIYLSQLVDELESWFFFCFHGFSGHWVQKIWIIFNFVDVLALWRHVMTSRQYLSSPYSTYWSCSWAIVRFLCKFYANLSCWYQTNHRYWFWLAAASMPQRHVMSSRCDVIPSYEIEAILVCLQFSHGNWPGSHTYCSIVV